MAIADLNKDGQPDIVSLGDHGNPNVNTQEHGLMVWFGDGAGGWNLVQNGSFGYGGVCVGDANNDGLLDIGYAMHHNGGSGDFGDQLIEVSLGDGTGRAWTPWDDGLATDGETYGMFGVVFTDFDNDGDLDLVANSFGCCNGLHAYRNNRDGTWTPVWRSGSGNGTEDIASGDVNNDGFSDVAAGYQTATVWLGDGTGRFVAADGNLPNGGSLGRRGPSLGDVNDDGRDDLAFATPSGGVQVWLWGDSARWQNASAGLPSNGPFEATQLRDMNADGEMDVVAMGNGSLAVWTGNGAGAWSNAALVSLPPPGYYSAFARPADLDHNGLPDLALVSESGSGFSTQNHPHVFREADAPSVLSVTSVTPRGGERARVGRCGERRSRAERHGARWAVDAHRIEPPQQRRVSMDGAAHRTAHGVLHPLHRARSAGNGERRLAPRVCDPRRTGRGARATVAYFRAGGSARSPLAGARRARRARGATRARRGAGSPWTTCASPRPRRARCVVGRALRHRLRDAGGRVLRSRDGGRRNRNGARGAAAVRHRHADPSPRARTSAPPQYDTDGADRRPAALLFSTRTDRTPRSDFVHIEQ
jgi:hypothetical protein